MKFLHFPITAVFLMSLAGFAVATPVHDQWANQAAWRLKLAVQRTPVHLTPVRTTANIKLLVAPNGRIEAVEVATKPTSDNLNTWIKKKLESIQSVAPFPNGEAHKINFSVKYESS
ncbi:hypothetical protein CQ054_21650 [Ochrobactrum sp. MYb29]|uniref:hypothetical protein n=1 Tax=Brucella pituitosa TaxID=571256 RepID=UPI000C275395|nr:hypothetical protein [Brucella pituitosa]PJO48223.1 hypothetical protein CWE02_09745 [Brucella pituitosa]PRA79376.1 hypothetical protein CQ054_21650 [Ochrobactrum sp. MYb29]TCQ72361.1 hypothetical protein EDF68_12210 [Ochrobactrum sp. BH3]